MSSRSKGAGALELPSKVAVPDVRHESRSRRRWAAAVILLAVCIAAPWAWQAWLYHAHLRMARQWLDLFAAGNAVNELKEAERIRPESAEVQFLLGVAQREAGHIDDVRAPLEKAMRLGWSKKEVRFQLTLLAFQSGDRDAEVELRKMMHRPLDDETAQQLYQSLTLGYLSEYRMHEAMLVLDYWIGWQPEHVRPRLLRAEIFELTQQEIKEEEEYEKVLEIDPRNYVAHLGLARVLEARHDIKHALENYRFCHEQWPADPGASAGIASCLTREGRLPEAKQVLNEMLRNRLPNPQRAAALASLAEFADQGGDVALAVKLLSEAIELDDHSSSWHHRLGVCLAKTGQKEKAKRSLDRATEIDRLAQQQYELELELVNRPDDADLRYELGDVMLKLGYPKPSAALMLSALRWDPFHQGAHAALVKYYEEIGREDLAEVHRADLLQDQQLEAERESEKVFRSSSGTAEAASSVAGVIREGSPEQ